MSPTTGMIASSDNSQSLFLQMMNFVQKLGNGLTPQTHLLIMLLLGGNDAVRQVDGLWKESSPEMEGKPQITSLDTWDLYVYHPFSIVLVPDEQCSW